MYNSIKNRLIEELNEINRNGRFKNERIIKSAQGSEVQIEKNTKVLNSEKPVLAIFSAISCGPCQKMSSAYKEISEELSDKVLIKKMDIDKDPNTPTQYSIRGVPSMLLFFKSELIGTRVGASTKSDLLNWIKSKI